MFAMIEAGLVLDRCVHWSKMRAVLAQTPDIAMGEITPGPTRWATLQHFMAERANAESAMG